MRAMKVFVAVIMLAISALSSSAMSLEMAQDILNRGKNYLLGDSINPDSAIICFQKVTATYRPELPLKQREICGTAANNLGFTYYQYLHDYKSAYEYMLKAKEICDNTGRAITKVNVCINLGNLYSVFSEQVGSPELEAEAVNSYREAFMTAHEHQMYDLMLYSFCNLTELGQGLKHIDQLTDILDKYATTDIPEGTSLERYAALRYRALRAYVDGDKELSTTYIIRELQNRVRRAVLISKTQVISASDLNIRQSLSTTSLNIETGLRPLKNDEEERQLIIRTLNSCGGNKAKAARLLNIDPSTLYRKINKYGIS